MLSSWLALLLLVLWLALMLLRVLPRPMLPYLVILLPLLQQMVLSLRLVGRLCLLCKAGIANWCTCW
jgi:hypothetical protein